MYYRIYLMVVHLASKVLCGGITVANRSRLLSHNLMLKNGYIYGVDTGLYAILPIGRPSKRIRDLSAFFFVFDFGLGNIFLFMDF